MSGILDSKSRIIDVILTNEGRRQLAQGQLRIDSYSFSDVGVSYDVDAVSGSADAAARLYLEACSLPQDRITFLPSAGGRISSLDGIEGVITDGQLLSFGVSNSGLRMTSVVTGSDLQDRIDGLLALPDDNFRKLMVLGTHDPLFEDDGFAVGPSEVKFVINSMGPVRDSSDHVIDQGRLEAIYQDPRFSRMPNFSFLPPINAPNDPSIDKTNAAALVPYALGDYRPWSSIEPNGLRPEQLEADLQAVSVAGFAQNFKFDPTTIHNRLVGQVFEVGSTGLSKLDVVDYGSYAWKGSHHHVFFVGRQTVGANGEHVFNHVFTLVFG